MIIGCDLHTRYQGGWPTHCNRNSKSHINEGCPILPRSVRKSGRREHPFRTLNIGSRQEATQAHCEPREPSVPRPLFIIDHKLQTR